MRRGGRATDCFQQSVESKLVGSVQALSSCTQSLPSITRSLEAVATDMRGVTKQFESTSDSQSELMTANASWTKNTLETYTAELYKSINQLAEPLGAVGTILKGFTPVMERSTSALDEFTKLSEAYSHMVHDELTPAKRSMEDLASSARGLSQLIAALRELMGHLEISTSQSLEINKSLDFTLRARATPTVEVLQRATGTFEDASHRLADCAEGLQLSVQNLLSSMSRVSRPEKPNATLAPQSLEAGEAG